MSQKKKILIFIIIIILILGISGLFLYKNIKNKKPNTEPVLIEVLDTIKDYDYNLEDRDLDIYKETFYKLSDVLKEEPVNYEEYSKLVAQLFLIDLYTIDNKISKYDVGSLEFVFPKEKEKFQNKVIDTLYKLVKDNTAKNRNQELPIVTNVVIDNCTSTTYKIDEETSLDAYMLDASITYQKDLGYDKKVKLIVAKEDNKVFVVNLTSEEEK